MEHAGLLFLIYTEKLTKEDVEKYMAKWQLEDGYICIPRGLHDNLLASCKEAGIEYDISDYREKGRPIRVSFNGDLKTQQNLAAQHLLAYDHGILSAATAFGKTVMNLLGKEDAWDNLMRIKSDQVAAELLEITLKKKSIQDSERKD